MVIDYSSDIGKLRLRVGDAGDLPFLPDEVYIQTLASNNGHLPKTAKDLACYILGILSSRGHRKLAQIEVWGTFDQYKEFLILTTTNPSFMDISPLPYGSGINTTHPLVQFQNDWNKNQYSGTQSQQLAIDAALSPNDGSLYGSAVGSY